MKTHAKQPESTSRTLGGDSVASRQVPLSDILLAYKTGNPGSSPVLSENIGNVKLLQTYTLANDNANRDKHMAYWEGYTTALKYHSLPLEAVPAIKTT